MKSEKKPDTVFSVVVHNCNAIDHISYHLERAYSYSGRAKSVFFFGNND